MISFQQIKCYILGMAHGDQDEHNLQLEALLELYAKSVEGASPASDTFLSFLQGCMQTCNSEFLPFLQKIEAFIRLSERQSVNNGRLNPLDFNKIIGDRTIPVTNPVPYMPYYVNPPPTLDKYTVTCSGLTSHVDLDLFKYDRSSSVFNTQS